MPFFLTSVHDHEGREVVRAFLLFFCSTLLSQETLVYYNSAMPHPGSLTPAEAIGNPNAAAFPRRSIESFLNLHSERYQQSQVLATRDGALAAAKQEGRWLHCEVRTQYTQSFFLTTLESGIPH